MVDYINKQRSTNVPSEIRQTGQHHIERLLFRCGLPFLCVSIACVVFPSITLLFLQSDFLGFLGWIIIIFCAGISLAIFLLGVICSVSSRAYRLLHAIFSFGAISVLLIAWIIIPRLEIYAFRKIDAKTEHVILQLVSEIESLRQQIGRLPENQSELAKLRSQPMPLSGWKTPIEYLKDPNASEYIIRTHHPDYIWLRMYNSRNPDAGIIHY